MTMEWTGPDKEQLEALGLLVIAQGRRLERMSAVMESTARRVYALQELLIERGMLTWAAIEARYQEIDLDNIADLELSPRYEEFRRHRDAIRRRQEEVDESPQT